MDDSTPRSRGSWILGLGVAAIVSSCVAALAGDGLLVVHLTGISAALLTGVQWGRSSRRLAPGHR